MMPTAGAILGTAGSPALLSMFNSEHGGKVSFGTPIDPYLDKFQNFLNYAIKPLEQTYSAIQDVAGIISSAIQNFKQASNDTEPRLIPITTEREFRDIPENMWIPILTAPPVRQLFEDGRLYGWGLTPEMLPREDVYGRLCSNGRADAFEVGVDEDIVLKWRWEGDDPDVAKEDLGAIRDTREFIVDNWLPKELMKPVKKQRDFTNWPKPMIEE